MLTRHYVWLVVGVVVAGSLVAVFFHRQGRRDTDAVRTSVRFHEALRARASEVAEQPWEHDAAIADQWARELLDTQTPAADVAVLPAFGAPVASVHEDRAHLLLAMVATRSKAELPAEILVHEAERISPEDLDSDLRALAEAARVYAYAEADRCDELSDPSATLEHPLLDGIRALVIDGAHGCCALRTGDLDRARERIARSADDAERLGVAVDRIPLLRAWAAFSANDSNTARAHLDQIVVEHLNENDLMRYRMLRNAVTSGDDTLLSILDPRWLSSIVVEGITEAISKDRELVMQIEDNPTAQAALRFVHMEAELLEHARAQNMLFDKRL